jgi:hypothetical protein
VGVKRPGYRQRYHPRPGRLVRGQRCKRVESAGGDDLSGAVVVGSVQPQLSQRRRNLIAITSEHGGHPSARQCARRGHLLATDSGECDGLVGGEHTGDRCRGQFAD